MPLEHHHIQTQHFTEPQAAMNDSDANTHSWWHLVERVQAGDATGLEELYRIFSRGIRFQLCRALGSQEVDDRVHDVFLVVVQAIQRGDLRDPERLMGFVRTVVRRHVAGQIEQSQQTRRDMLDIESGAAVADHMPTPEEELLQEEKVAIMREILMELSHRDREVLERFYLREQTQEEICADMRLSETQFRLLKSRAKARFGETGRRKLARNAFASYFLRRFSSISH